jgi:hypothetical protein
MKHPGIFLIAIMFCLLWQQPAVCQKINGEIFIPLNNRSEIWLKPKLDTLDNKREYEFKIRVSPEFTISQFLFEKGLAVQNDSMLVITPNSTKYGDYDTATLRVIVTSIKGSRIMLFQKRFIIRVPEKMFPVISNPKTNLMKVNDKVFLDRNKPYPKNLFVENHPFMTLYNNLVEMKKIEVKGVTVALMEREGKQYISNGDTLSTEAIREIKKIKNPTPVYIRVDGQSGKSKKTVWNRIIVYND